MAVGVGDGLLGVGGGSAEAVVAVMVMPVSVDWRVNRVHVCSVCMYSSVGGVGDDADLNSNPVMPERPSPVVVLLLLVAVVLDAELAELVLKRRIIKTIQNVFGGFGGFLLTLADQVQCLLCQDHIVRTQMVGFCSMLSVHVGSRLERIRKLCARNKFQC